MTGVAFAAVGVAAVGVGAGGVGGALGATVAAAGVGLALLGVHRLGRALISPRLDTALCLSALWLSVLVLAAVLAPILPLGEHVDTSKTLGVLSYLGPFQYSDHPLGTNNLGLDELARVVYGARATLSVSVAAVLLGLAVGGALGLVAGYVGGSVDLGIGILTNALLAFPPLILLLALASVLEPNLRNITIALAILTVPANIRLARANTIAFAQREFVLAARAMGATTRRVLLRELLPSVLLQLASYAMVLISVLIVAEASLSFLGLGVQEPAPSWGNMIAEGLDGVFEQHPHIVLVPGTALFLTVFAFNLVAEKVHARFSPGQVQL